MTAGMPTPSQQLALLRSSRSIALIAGVLALIGGVLVLAWPGKTIETVAIVVGIFLAVGGMAQIIDALVTHKAGTYWGLLVVRGVLDLAVGLVAVFWPAITVWALVLLIGIELILAGVVSVIAGLTVPAESGLRPHLLSRGVVSILVGIVVIAWPGATVLVVAVLLGIYLVAFGLVLLWAGYQLGKADRMVPAA
ncbi:HdeD family acid-resistance protein [Rhabdothermincola sp.]|uniref:HdeD family acid-resistance protein n=1 Tax=Rhabdothermincola sp. TaxID=2820405 RepID=UPI002FE0660D